MRLAVFRTGRHTDSNGHEREWTEGDLDRIAAGYDPARHEAPVVIGHPKENAPAYGWVEKLERVGDVLWAEIKPTVEGFSDWVRHGLWKKRSVSLYPDLTLRHIGFLGATPPAVKGLPDIQFKEKEEVLIEMAEEDKEKEEHETRVKKHGIGVKADGHGTKPGKYKDIPDDEFGDPVNYKYPLDEEHIHAALAYWAKPHNRADYSKEEQEKITHRILAAAKKHGVDVDEEKFKFTEGGSKMGVWEELKSFLKGKGVDVEGDSFAEERVKAAAEVVRKAKTEADAEFAERERGLKERETALERRALEGRKREVAEFCEGLKKKGILTPAMEKAGMGITAFMQAISGIEATYEFAEADEHGGRGKQRPYEFMRDFLSRLPAQINFAEVANKEDDQEEGDGETRREKAIRRHMKDHGMEDSPKNYKRAMLEVSKKRPELFEMERR